MTLIRAMLVEFWGTKSSGRELKRKIRDNFWQMFCCKGEKKNGVVAR